METDSVPNTSTTLSAEAHLVEGQSLLQEKTIIIITKIIAIIIIVYKVLLTVHKYMLIEESTS
jgi:hypothetical protein